MEDYLLKLCSDRDIELFFTNNLTPVLSSYVEYGIRIIVAYYAFRESPEDVAAAVVNYFTQEKDKELNLDIIKKYIKLHFRSGIYKVDNIELVLGEEAQKEPVTKVEEDIKADIPEVKEQMPKTKRQSRTDTKSGAEPITKSITLNKKQNEIDIVIEEEQPAKPKQKKPATSKKSNPGAEKNSIAEIEIRNITKKSFKGNTTEIISDEIIQVSEDDVVELDITVDPFNT